MLAENSAQFICAVFVVIFNNVVSTGTVTYAWYVDMGTANADVNCTFLYVTYVILSTDVGLYICKRILSRSGSSVMEHIGVDSVSSHCL